MKKMLVLVLAIVMVMSLATPAAALASPGASAEDLLPSLSQKYVSVILHDVEKVTDLSKDTQNLMAEAKENLKAACPEGFAVKYFFYVEIIGADKVASVDFDAIEHTEIMFMQYIDGEWVELEYSVNEDGKIVVQNVVEAPLAIFTK